VQHHNEEHDKMAVKKRTQTLSHGRPPATRPKERMSSLKSRTIIRTHHQLEKQKAAAVKKGDAESAVAIAKAIEENGGLKVYQAASKQGQSKDRGGDSSKVLVEWLRGANIIHDDIDKAKDTYRCLEVGALSTKNEISKFTSQIEMTRIDLNSQGSGITKQDFMERPLPEDPDETFDIISLSLVLNYVPDAPQRGEMLKRVVQFLRKTTDVPAAESKLPALFLVLPLPCVKNSRYLDEKLLVRIAENLGFTLTKKKITPKLCYYLFSLTGTGNSKKTDKKKVRDGRTMNNFCIVVE
jgi:25S rRNA (adenine2142-N1)-methyltransferase